MLLVQQQQIIKSIVRKYSGLMQYSKDLIAFSKLKAILTKGKLRIKKSLILKKKYLNIGMAQFREERFR